MNDDYQILSSQNLEASHSTHKKNKTLKTVTLTGFKFKCGNNVHNIFLYTAVVSMVKWSNTQHLGSQYLSPLDFESHSDLIWENLPVICGSLLWNLRFAHQINLPFSCKRNNLWWTLNKSKKILYTAEYGKLYWRHDMNLFSPDIDYIMQYLHAKFDIILIYCVVISYQL